MTVCQGDIYYVDLGEPKGSEPGYWHYVVIVQSDVMNATRVGTAVACVLTKNLKRGRIPGNITLNSKEGKLPLRSVVNISQMVTIDKDDLGPRIGTMHWEALIVRLVIEAAGGSESSAIERRLHAAFGFLKIRGEWYRYAGPLESFVNRRWLVEACRRRAYGERESA